MNKSNRVRVVSVPWVHLEELLLAGADPGAGWPKLCAVIRYGLPAGARIVNSREDPFTRAVHFLVEHPSFDEVPAGQHPPWHDAYVASRVYERLDRNTTEI